MVDLTHVCYLSVYAMPLTLQSKVYTDKFLEHFVSRIPVYVARYTTSLLHKLAYSLHIFAMKPCRVTKYVLNQLFLFL